MTGVQTCALPILVFHDDDLERMTGVKKLVKNSLYSEIQSLNLDNTSYKIPLLEEVLNLVNGEVPIIIELKYDVKIRKIRTKTYRYFKKL